MESPVRPRNLAARLWVSGNQRNLAARQSPRREDRAATCGD